MVLREHSSYVDRDRGDFKFSLQEAGCFSQILHGYDMQASYHRGFGGIFWWHKDSGLPLFFGPQRNRQHPFYGANSTIQRQLADHYEPVELSRFDLLAGSQHPDRNRQIEARSPL